MTPIDISRCSYLSLPTVEKDDFQDEQNCHNFRHPC